MQTILCDTRQKLKHHESKEEYFAKVGLNIMHTKLPVGDYANMKDWSVIVDTKKDIQEAIGNICSKKHVRFRNECIKAQENGIKLIILIADEHIKSLKDLAEWSNPRAKIMRWDVANGKRVKVQKYPKATQGVTLARAMETMNIKYGVEFRFCPERFQGAAVCKLLGFKKGD